MDELTRRVCDLAAELIAIPSVTPVDGGCQNMLEERLKALGFACEYFNAEDVTNLWATKALGAAGDGSPHLCFAGHTDVVPTGPLEEWDSDPFSPQIRNNKLYGRGAADMKSSLAAMIIATENLLEADSGAGLDGWLSFLVTSDEEGPAVHGTRHVIDALRRRRIKPDFCIVGEPSSSVRLGDVVRCGRRGSLNGTLTFLGEQGHVAYPQDATNPIHLALPALAALTATVWDEGSAHYPPTSLQISNIHAGTGASNVIPGTLEVRCNFRFNNLHSGPDLEHAVEAILNQHGLPFRADWTLSGNPFLTEPGRLTSAVSDAITTHTGIVTELSTSGGTSDGRFIAPWGGSGRSQVEVVELGPTNATIHKINEHVNLDELAPLSRIYETTARNLLSDPGITDR